MRGWIRTADADQLVELMALSNAALPDEDFRRIRPDDVRMLRRLAGQARSLNSSLTATPPNEDRWESGVAASRTVGRVRIGQGGGTRQLVRDAPPVPVLIFGALDGGHSTELASEGDAGRWELVSYLEIQLRELLAEAQAHGNEPNAE